MLSVVFQEKKTSEELFEIYIWRLSDFSEEVLIGAIEKCLDTYKFFPSISEIRKQADEHKDWLEAEDLRNKMKQSRLEAKKKYELDK